MHKIGLSVIENVGMSFAEMSQVVSVTDDIKMTVHVTEDILYCLGGIKLEILTVYFGIIYQCKKRNISINFHYKKFERKKYIFYLRYN